MNISIYNTAGEILRWVSCPQSMIALQEIPEGGGYVEGAFDDTLYYVVDEVPTPRPTTNPSIVSTTISNLPIPCGVQVNGETIEVPNDDTLELSFELPGTYKVKVTSWPYLDWEGTIDAV